MKPRNKAHQVRRYDPAFDIQHKWRVFGPVIPTPEKTIKGKRIRLGISLRILQLNVEVLAASKLDFVERLAVEYDVAIIHHNL